MRSPRKYTRRRLLGVAAGAGIAGVSGSLFAATRRASAPSDAASAAAADGLNAAVPDSVRVIHGPSMVEVAPVQPSPPPAVRPRGREDVLLMAGTEWEAQGTIHHSGVLGPRVMVLGGVHGNEPGGWMGAEAVANWEVRRGSLIVLPRLNWRAAAAFERTLDGFGDLNRLYPGHPEGLPMARMAAEVTAIAQFWRPLFLWDMHESWGFFNERGENGGTAFIGQTVTTADTPGGAVVEDVVRRVNGAVAEREAFSMRSRPGGVFGSGGSNDPVPNRTPTPEELAMRTLPDGTRGSSSLSMGRFVSGVSPVLVEMGQMNQPEERRSELHQLLMRELLTDLRMV